MAIETKLTELPKFTDDLLLTRTANAEFEKPVLYTALKNNLFDTISAEGPTNMADLIKKCRFPKRGGEAVINLVTALGYLKCIDGKYNLTDVSKTFFVNTPFDWKFSLTNFYQPQNLFTNAWEKDVNGEITGAVTENWVDTNAMPEGFAENFTKIMEYTSLTRAIAIGKNFDLNKKFGITKILDVAGGSGSFSRAIAANQPKVKAVVLELPSVCTICDEYIKKSNLSEGAVVTYACDMFKEPYPDCNDPKYGYQAIFMSNILHDWDDKTCRFLCKKAYDALPPGGTIILHENLLNEDGDGPLHAALMNIHMFVFARGKQFKFSELKQLLKQNTFC